MKIFRLGLAAFVLGALAPVFGGTDTPAESGPPFYANSGDNTEGFDLKYGNCKFTVVNGVLSGSMSGGWVALPVFVTSDFKIDFDVFGDSGDVDSYLILADDNGKEGIMFRNCPQDTDDSSIAIHYIADLTDHDQFYFPHQPLVFASARKFPNKTWVHITITKVGNTLTDNVGGQVISCDISDLKLPSGLRIGLGYYATTNLGGTGRIGYQNIRVVGLESR